MSRRKGAAAKGVSFGIRRAGPARPWPPGPLSVGGWRGVRRPPSWRRGSAVAKRRRFWSLETGDRAWRDRGGGAALTCSRRGLVAGLQAAGRPGAGTARRARGAECAPRAARGCGACAPRGARRARVSRPCVRRPWVPAAACACAHTGTAFAWSRRCQSPPEAKARRPPPALARPASRSRPAGSALRERRRLRREARPGAGGRRRTTTSPRALRRLGGGVQANGRPGEGLGRGWGGGGGGSGEPDPTRRFRSPGGRLQQKLRQGPAG